MRPLQCLLRFAATEDHEVIRIVHDLRSKLLPSPRLPPALPHPVHVQIGERWADHPALRSTSIVILPARQPPLPVFLPLLDRHLYPPLDQTPHLPIADSPT